MRPWFARLLIILGVFVTNNLGGPTIHWAFAPISDEQPPKVENEQWCHTPIDRFVLARLEETGGKRAEKAEPRTLIRRITFDLAGLPPTPREVDQFAQEFERDSAAAVNRLVDRLLASPQYGERWGRWWLDVARYADTNGQDENK